MTTKEGIHSQGGALPKLRGQALMRTKTHAIAVCHTTANPVVAGVELTTDSEGRFNLNILHKASGLPKSKAPNKWMELEGTKELIRELETRSGQTQDLESAQKLISAINGGKTPGTYAHELLAVEYAGWLSPGFRLDVNQSFIDWRTGQISSLGKAGHWRKIRSEARDYGKIMCDAMKDARDDLGKGTKSHHYSNEHRMINAAVLGMDGGKWMAERGLSGIVRDHMTAKQLDLVAALERVNGGLIEVGMVYQERKELLQKRALALSAKASTLVANGEVS
ncbi:KilA-N domain-containing protein [Aeromonas caviae]|uniref:KilA-N domain-containing protein n=1 Tax=Aeromonas caviae TaxID=648 RepID=UPI003F745230